MNNDFFFSDLKGKFEEGNLSGFQNGPQHSQPSPIPTQRGAEDPPAQRVSEKHVNHTSVQRAAKKRNRTPNPGRNPLSERECPARPGCAGLSAAARATPGVEERCSGF